MLLVAVDIGGTFTDLVAYDEESNRFFQSKADTTPNDLVQGIVDCIKRSAISVGEKGTLIHGSTIAINTLIERKGASTALIVTRGTRDVYSIGRGNRPESYNIDFRRPRPLVSRDMTLEVDERLDADAEVLVPLKADQVREIASVISKQGAEAVAVCFLHSYANPAHEREAGRILKEMLPGKYVSLSHEILREFREYERISTTAVNAYIGPKVSRYVHDLESRLVSIGFKGDVSIMQSNGGVMTPSVAAKRPVSMMESGPVGGIIASAKVCAVLGFDNAISFDMGGTTAKASLVLDRVATMADGYYVGGYASGDPVMLPVVEVVEVGAGGGSIAWIDEVGALKVGPQSAGSDPGPICYGRGGEEPTITDANVVLGRVGASDFLGGDMLLDHQAASRGIAEIARRLGSDARSTAKAIIEIAIAKMSLAVREVSVHKGHDPRDFVLVAFGGAGPLHASAIARELHIPTVVVPRFPAHFSALGMLMTDERHDFVRTCMCGLEAGSFVRLRSVWSEMLEEAGRVVTRPGTAGQQISLDLRYAGQEFTLPVPVTARQLQDSDAGAVRKAFDELHEFRYAHHAPSEPVEVVNMRLVLVTPRPKLRLPDIGASAAGSGKARTRQVFLESAERPVECPVYQRDTLSAATPIRGPALVQEYASATVLFTGDACTVAETGELIISVRSSQ